MLPHMPNLSTPSAPASPVPNKRVRARGSARILAAARTFVDVHGLEQLSMRRLADEADVSVRTIYNLFGDKRGLVTALVRQSLDAMELAVGAIEASDPIARIWEAATISVDSTTRHVPRSVVTAVLSDATLYRRLAVGRHGRALIPDAIRAAVDAGALHDDLAPDLLVQQAGTVHLHLLRRWAAGEIDEDVLRAGVLYSFDICLLAIARPATRQRLLDHIATLNDARGDLLELGAYEYEYEDEHPQDHDHNRESA